MIDRRSLLAGGLALCATPGFSRTTGPDKRFPANFLWGAATAGHQVEGNNVNSDTWLLEHVFPTSFEEPSGDAANSFELWREDIRCVQNLGLNTYRFSLEWSRIEPAPGQFSQAMLDHYKTIIEVCRRSGLSPVVTFNHFSVPVWFAALGGWSNPEAPNLFARYCESAARHLAGGIAFALTLNEPNLPTVLRGKLPQVVFDRDRANSEAAARATGVPYFEAGNALWVRDPAATSVGMLKAHEAGRNAIKKVRPDLPVGLSLAVWDDQITGSNSVRDARREKYYGDWLQAVGFDDFVGVQNYERAVWGSQGQVPPPAGTKINALGGEVYAPSLANAVAYVHHATKRPILVTEHGIGTNDDTVRAKFIPDALRNLLRVIATGIPVIGYIHWSLIDNFEWSFGYKMHFGLHEVSPRTFKRTAKPSALMYGSIARHNSL